MIGRRDGEILLRRGAFAIAAVLAFSWGVSRCAPPVLPWPWTQTVEWVTTLGLTIQQTGGKLSGNFEGRWPYGKAPISGTVNAKGGVMFAAAVLSDELTVDGSVQLSTVQFFFTGQMSADGQRMSGTASIFGGSMPWSAVRKK